MEEIKITSQNFETEVVKSELPVLLDFWAPWCNPCKLLGPVISQIAKENSHIKVGKINVDEEKSLAKDFEIMSIPTLIIMKDGKPLNSCSGFMPKEMVEKFINQSLEK